MLKRDEVANPNSCLNKAADDEPIFVLRAKDPLAADAVRHWVTLCQLLLTQDEAKLQEALALAKRMEDWYTANRGKHGPF